MLEKRKVRAVYLKTRLQFTINPFQWNGIILLLERMINKNCHPPPLISIGMLRRTKRATLFRLAMIGRLTLLLAAGWLLAASACSLLLQWKILVQNVESIESILLKLRLQLSSSSSGSSSSSSSSSRSSSSSSFLRLQLSSFRSGASSSSRSSSSSGMGWLQLSSSTSSSLYGPNSIENSIEFKKFEFRSSST